MASPSQSAQNPTLAKAINYHKTGQFERALKNYRRVLKQSPTHLDALVMGGQAAFQAGYVQEAVRWLKKASEKHTRDPRAPYNLGVVYQQLGETHKACKAFKEAATVGPDFAPAHYNLAMTLFELGNGEEALPHFDHAIGADPAYSEAYASKGFVLRGLSRINEAVDTYRKAVELAPENAKSCSGLGVCLQEAGEFADALVAHENAIRIDPDYPDATINFCDALVQIGKPAEAIQACNAYLERHPADAGVLASKSIALNETGETGELKELVDLERLVIPFRQNAPSGFRDMDHFNSELGEFVLRHPTLIVSPASHATRDGKHTGTINTGNKGPIAALEGLITSAVELYVDAASETPHHPIVAYRPKNYSLSVWAVVLEGKGFQLPHIHPSAWLSGVYYVRVPQVADEGGPDGWIEFGQPGPEYHFSADPALRLVKPEPGMMVMFPSFMFHRTIPFQSDETRISVAFDVLPA